MNIILTGGAGFIASHIGEAYIKRGHRVAVIDNLSTGSRNNLPKKAKLYKEDIRNAKAIEKILRIEHPDVINHHAALINVTESVEKPILTYEINVLGTMNLLISFGKYSRGKRKFIFASSGGSIYGNPREIPAREETSPNPLSPYALSKLLAEEAIKFQSKTDGFNYTILRYANVYGPRQKNGIVPIFGKLMKSGKRPIIFGDGSKTRDYVYVEDIASASLKSLDGGLNKTLNIGWGKETSDQRVFDEIKRVLNFKKKAIYAARREGEVERITLNPSRARKALGWSAKITLREGIGRTVPTLL